MKVKPYERDGEWQVSYLDKLLGKDEAVVFSTRRHWTFFFGASWFSLLLFVLAVAAAIGINIYTSSLTFGLPPDRQIIAREGIVILLLIYPIGSILVRYFRWQAEQYVVSNLRVIHLNGIFSKSVIDSSLEKVNDIMLNQSLVGRVFDYGDLEILTASEAGINKFAHIAHPLAFKGAMLNAKRELEQMGNREVDQIPDVISKLAGLRDQGVISEDEFQTEKTRLLRQL